jgi:predicted Fe-Mo cluster-binding NifX family protein
MKIAVAMQNGEEIQTGHFGQALRYFIYETTDNSNSNKYTLVEKRKNPHHGKHKHAKVEEIEEVLGDCSVWIGSKMGKGSMKYLPTAGITPFLTSESSPGKAVDEFLRQAADSRSTPEGSDNAPD